MIFGYALRLFLLSKYRYEEIEYLKNHIGKPPTTNQRQENVKLEDLKCDNPVWCTIEMPKVSYYKFPPPTDPLKWRRAQIQAANGDQVLLQRISKVFPQPFDFLDGDRSFRRLHYLIDVFVDQKRSLDAITKPTNGQDGSTGMEVYEENRRLMKHLDEEIEKRDEKMKYQPNPWDRVRRLQNEDSKKEGEELTPWEKEHRRVIPEPYIYRYGFRAPIVQMV